MGRPRPQRSSRLHAAHKHIYSISGAPFCKAPVFSGVWLLAQCCKVRVRFTVGAKACMK